MKSNVLQINSIKSNDTLTLEDLKKLQIMFVKYYLDRFCSSIHLCGQTTGFLSATKLLFYRRAKRDIDQIREGKSFVVVKYQGSAIKGFILGEVEGWKEAKLTQYYVEEENRLEARSITLELYRNFLKILKNRGVQSIVASARFSENRFIDALETLHFECISETSTSVKYGYKISPLQ